MNANLTFRPNVRLTKELNSKGEAFIIIRLSFNKQRVNLGTGYTISPDKWDETTEKVKRNATNSQNLTFAEINDGIANAIHIINGIFKTVLEGVRNAPRPFQNLNGRLIVIGNFVGICKELQIKHDVFRNAT